MIKIYGWLILCVAVWGSNFVFGKLLVQDFSPTMLTMLRLFFIVLFLVLYATVKKSFKKIQKKQLWMILFLGIMGVFINQWSFFKGLETADPTTSALILATAPVLTGFLAAIFLKERFTLRMVVGSLLAITGIYFVVTKGGKAALSIDKGLLWIVVTMVTFAIMIIITRILSKTLDSLTVTLYSNIVGFVISIPFAFSLDQPIHVGTSFSSWLFLIVTAIAVHGIATLIWNSQIRYVGASKASILSNLEPFIAMVMGLILLSKPITGAEIIGSIFIVGGVIWSTTKRRKFFNRTVSSK
ncbi:permease [Virgibacillus soli]|nr:permease [Virgibacillus soli]